MTTPARPADFPDLDYFEIEGNRSPGQCRILKANSPRGWDERKGYAQDGSTLVPTGDPLADVEIGMEFWLPEHIIDWYAFAAKYFDAPVRFVPGSITPKALGIWHPVLAAAPLRITQVVVVDCTALMPDGYGLWTCTISLKQYRKPTPALSKPDAAIPAHATAQPSAQTAAQREMDANGVQIGGLGHTVAKIFGLE